MKIKAENILRRVIYQKVKKANAPEQTEIAYSAFGDYEIITIHTKPKREFWLNETVAESIKTYRWFGDCQTELLQEYKSFDDAIKGHEKWCQKEFKDEI